MAEQKGSAFERDFGYLMPFLDRVGEAAKALQDASARDELTRLMANQKEQWRRIQELLAGRGGQSVQKPAAPMKEAPAAAVEPPAPPELRHPLPRNFTVGPLKRGR